MTRTPRIHWPRIEPIHRRMTDPANDLSFGKFLFLLLIEMGIGCVLIYLMVAFVSYLQKVLS